MPCALHPKEGGTACLLASGPTCVVPRTRALGKARTKAGSDCSHRIKSLRDKGLCVFWML